MAKSTSDGTDDTDDPASSGQSLNGQASNGRMGNGPVGNGPMANGPTSNGPSPNGPLSNGHAAAVADPAAFDPAEPDQAPSSATVIASLRHDPVAIRRLFESGEYPYRSSMRRRPTRRICSNCNASF